MCFNEFRSMILIERLFQIKLGHPRLILAQCLLLRVSGGIFRLTSTLCPTLPFCLLLLPTDSLNLFVDRTLQFPGIQVPKWPWGEHDWLLHAERAQVPRAPRNHDMSKIEPVCAWIPRGFHSRYLCLLGVIRMWLVPDSQKTLSPRSS